MEAPVVKNVRLFRGEETILNILTEYKKSKLSVKEFCFQNNIASATFHNWKKKYSRRSVKSARPVGFAALQITQPVTSEPALFAEVNGIKIYQWVTGAYLKELLS
ncbi:MAG: transposase [Taibaiella sp.]|nr:transposase [Taibaiella sp.]